MSIGLYFAVFSVPLIILVMVFVQAISQDTKKDNWSGVLNKLEKLGWKLKYKNTGSMVFTKGTRRVVFPVDTTPAKVWEELMGGE